MPISSVSRHFARFSGSMSPYFTEARLGHMTVHYLVLRQAVAHVEEKFRLGCRSYRLHAQSFDIGEPERLADVLRNIESKGV